MKCLPAWSERIWEYLHRSATLLVRPTPLMIVRDSWCKTLPSVRVNCFWTPVLSNNRDPTCSTIKPYRCSKNQAESLISTNLDPCCSYSFVSFFPNKSEASSEAEANHLTLHVSFEIRRHVHTRNFLSLEGKKPKGRASEDEQKRSQKCTAYSCTCMPNSEAGG